MYSIVDFCFPWSCCVHTLIPSSLLGFFWLRNLLIENFRECNPGCLPFNQKNWLVDSCKWDATKHQIEISMGSTCSIFTDISTGTDSTRKEVSKWNAYFSFGNFGLPFSKSRFLWNFTVWEALTLARGCGGGGWRKCKATLIS